MVATEAEQYAKPKPAAGQRSLWNEEDHPRGQPENAGEFASHPGAKSHGTPKPTPQPTPASTAASTAAPPDAATDYKQNGTRAKAFKAWFGDWENDPANASKVVDPETGEPQETSSISGEGSKVVKDGKPVAVYHGTSRGGFESFDKGFLGNTTSGGSAEGLLYGPGFYFTEDKSIADEYSSNGKAENSVVPVEDSPEVRAKLIEAIEAATAKMEKTRQELFGHLSPEEFATFREDTDEMRKVVEDLKRGRSIEKSVRFVAKGDAMNLSALEKMGVKTAGLLKVKSSREVKEVFLSIKKPFDIDDGKFDTADLPRDVLQQHAQKRKDNAATARKNQIRYGEMADDQRKRNATTRESLKASGVPVEILKDPNTYRIGVAQQGSEVRNAWDGLNEDQQDAWTDYVGKVNQADYFQNMSNHHREMFEEATSKDTGLTYGGLESILRAKTAVNKALQDAGYDGLTHIGGSIMGGGHNHRVWIAFEPNQIKSVDNQGTFNAGDNRINYSRRFEELFERYARVKPAAGHKSLFDEHDHPRGQPENAGEFAPKSGGANPATKSLFGDDSPQHTQHAPMVSAFEAAFAKPAKPPAPLWQPKMFDAEPTGQKTMFDAGIEKGHGKPKAAAAKSLFSGPSLVEQIESELSKMAKANKPLPQQKGMFSRQGAVSRYQQQWDESKHPRDEGGRFSEVAALAHVASGKPFREWASSMVPHLEQRGYGNVEAQQIAFKASQRVHRREKSEPIENAVKDAVGTLNHWADKKGPPVAAPQQQPEQPAEQAPEQTPPEPAIPAAPEWFNRLKEALEHRKSTGATAENPNEADIGKTAVSTADDGGDVHFKEWTPDDGAEAAPPPVVAKLPDAIEPLSPLKQLPNGSLVGSTQMHVNDLKVDPKRFQYKFVGVGDDGVTKELKDAKRFNPMLGGQLLVWRDPGDGQTYVINGHHRFDLAKRSLAGGDSGDSWNGNLSVYFIDADSPATARALGAVTNIAEGRGTAVDAAKFLRDTNANLADLEQHGVSEKGAMARDAVPLSKLSPRIWQKVAQETVTPARGLAIAKHLGSDPEAQDQLFNIVEQREQKTGKDIPDSHVEEMAREMSMTPKHTESGGGLFGDFFERSLLPERANLKAAVRRTIMGEKNAFAAVSSTRRAGTLESEGKNQLDTEGNRERALQSARQLEDFEQQSNWAGHPIAAAVNEAAQRLANEPRKAKSIEKQLIDHVRGILAGSAEHGDDQLEPGRQPVTNADSSGSREGEPERHRRQRESHQSLVAMFDRALRKSSTI